MKTSPRWTLPRTALLLTLSVITLSVLGSGPTSAAATRTAAPDPTDWRAVLQAARGQKVNFYMWGGSDNINRYVDTVVAPAAARLGVTVRRVPLTDTVVAVNKLLGERQAGLQAGGGVDLIWINGENFKTAQQAGLLLENWAQKLPNARLIDWQSSSVNRDFGLPVRGAESPWGSTQWQYVYDSARVSGANLPRSFAGLAQWAKAHPGRFTFVAPPDFYGNRFLRMALVELAGGPKVLEGPFSQARWNRYAPRLWTYLTALRPNLWRGGQSFPSSIAQQYTLLSNGEVDFAFVQNKAGIAAEVAAGQLPKTARVYLFSGGTVSDAHYVAIPRNAAHPAAAMVLANLLEDPALQLKKLSGEVWGDGLAIQPEKVSAAYARQVQAALKVGPYTLAPAVLSRAAYGDLVAEYDQKVQDGFKQLLK